MQALIVTDDELMGSKLCAIALRCGVECDPAHVTAVDVATEVLSRSRHDIVILAVPTDRQRALSILWELRQAASGALLVVGEADDPKFILRVLREGANEFIDLAVLDADLEAALSRLRTKQEAPSGDNGRVIGVVGCGGGCGASTLAVNVAAALAKKAQRCSLIDLRLSAGDQALLLDLKPTHTLSELCRNSERMDPSMFQQVLTPHYSGVHLLAAPGRDEGSLAHVTASGVRQVLVLSRSLFPYTVIDVDRLLGPEQLAALLHADLILLVLRLDMTSLHGAQRLLDRITRLGVPESRLQVVVNRYGQPKELPAGRAERVLGVELTHYVPNDPATVNSGNNKGVPVVIERPNSKVARSFVKLAMSVNHPESVHQGNGHRQQARNNGGGLLSRWWPSAVANGKR